MNPQELSTALYLMQGQPLTATQAVRLILEALETLGEGYSPAELVPLLRDCIRRGIREHVREATSTSFADAVAQTLQSKHDRSPRTIQDFRQCMNTLMRRVAGLAERQVSSFTPEQCRNMLEMSFDTPTRRRKAHACLSSLFHHSQSMGWCRENPMRHVQAPRVRERAIRALSLAEIERLLDTAQMPEHRACLPALGLMLYAGVRPHEVMRLSWREVDWEEQEVTVPARHAKTGGGRHIPIFPALKRLLRKHPARGSGGRVCPPNWQNRWKRLRRAAGFTHWQQDVLRHTFASYYTKAYRDLASLQLYMGHRDASLLLTRYVNLDGLKGSEARRFFGGTGACKLRHERKKGVGKSHLR